MHFALVVLLTIIPSIAVELFVLTRVKRRVPVIVVFAVGYFAALPALLLESAIPEVHPVVKAFFVVALIEELTKLTLVAVAGRNGRPSANRKYAVDLVPFGVSAGMGMAAFENILASDVSTILLRSVTALPLHLSTGLLMASVLQKRRSSRRFVLALAVAVLVHGIYDLPLFVSATYRWMLVPIAFVLIAYCTVRLIRWYRQSPHHT